MRWHACLAALLALGCVPEVRYEVVRHGRFDELSLIVPSHAQTLVLLLSDRGEQARGDPLAAQLRAAGAVVAAIDARAFLRTLEADPGACALLAGELENLAHFVQAYVKLTSYRPAILVGSGRGAGAAAAALLQAPPHTFAGAIVADASCAFALQTPLCEGAGLVRLAPPPTQTFRPARRLTDPLYALDPRTERACSASTPPGGAKQSREAALNRAYGELAERARRSEVRAPSDLADLPIVEVPSQGAGQGDAFAVLISGDGGWAGIDKALSAQLARHGVPVVGVDSLRYFWSARTPQGVADDIDRLIRRYQQTWRRKRVLLLGYSQGADVLPFVLNRLPSASRAAVVGAVAMSISADASFEFHLANWLGGSGDLPVLPELRAVAPHTLTCIYGERDRETICPRLDPRAFRVIALPGGHHFDGDYPRLAMLVLEGLQAGAR